MTDGRHLENSKNLNMFATDRPILNFDVCRPLHSNSQSNFVISKIQDGGNGHFGNSKNRNISATERPTLITFSTMMSLGLSDTACQWNLTNLKIQDGGGRHFEKLKNHNIYATDWQILRYLACWCASTVWTPLADKISQFQKCKMAAAANLKIEKLQ